MNEKDSVSKNTPKNSSTDEKRSDFEQEKLPENIHLDADGEKDEVQEVKNPDKKLFTLLVAAVVFILLLLFACWITSCSKEPEETASAGSEASAQQEKLPSPYDPSEKEQVPLGTTVSIGGLEVSTSGQLVDTTNPQQPYICKQLNVVVTNVSDKEVSFDWDQSWKATSSGEEVLNLSHVILEGGEDTDITYGHFKPGAKVTAAFVLVFPTNKTRFSSFEFTPAPTIDSTIKTIEWSSK